MLNFIPSEIRLADYLAAVVDTLGEAKSTSKASEVNHGAVIPQERIQGWKAAGVWTRACEGGSRYEAIALKIASARGGKCVRPTQRAKVLHDSAFPNEGMRMRGERR